MTEKSLKGEVFAVHYKYVEVSYARWLSYDFLSSRTQPWKVTTYLT